MLESRDSSFGRTNSSSDGLRSPLFREERNFAIVSVSPFVSASSFGEFGPVVHAEIITTTGV